MVIPLIIGSTVLYRVKPRPPTADQFYHFSLFALVLNEANDELMKKLPPTDSRRRMDIRLMESGDIGEDLRVSA